MKRLLDGYNVAVSAKLTILNVTKLSSNSIETNWMSIQSLSATTYCSSAIESFTDEPIDYSQRNCVINMHSDYTEA